MESYTQVTLEAGFSPQSLILSTALLLLFLFRHYHTQIQLF